MNLQRFDLNVLELINESNTHQLNIEMTKSVADDFKKYTLMCGDCFDGNSNMDLNRKLLHLSR